MPTTTTTPYLFFKGDCADAMKFYEKALNGKLELIRFADTPGGSPNDMPPDGIMHAYLTFDGGALMASDDMTPSYKPMAGFYVAVSYPTVDEATRTYEALSNGAKNIVMPLGKTFWSEAFSMFVDRYGTPWMISQASERPE